MLHVWSYILVSSLDNFFLLHELGSLTGSTCPAYAGSKKHRNVRRANRLIRRIIYVPLGVNKFVWLEDWFCKHLSRNVLQTHFHSHVVLISFDILKIRCEYLFKKGIHYCIENPMTTLLWTYAPMEVTINLLLTRFKLLDSLFIGSRHILLCRRCFEDTEPNQ